MDIVIRHWMTVVVGEEAEQEVFGRSVQRPEAAFYMDGGLLNYPQTEQLREDLVILTGMFNRVRLSNNVEKMVGTTLTTLVGGVWTEDDGRRPVVLGPPKVEGPLIGLLYGTGEQVNGEAPPVPERYCLGGTVGKYPAYNRPPTPLVIFTK